ncbi:MAG: universal stress protein [Rubrobacteraceae bacterium]
MNALQPLKFRRILVPVDESRPSQNSLSVAAGMARASEATVVLAHVAEMSYSQDRDEMLATYGEHVVEDFRRYGEDLLKNTAESETFSGIKVETETLFGDPARALMELAGQKAIDAIVMGSHGRGTWGTMIVGSVSQRVIHEAKVPVVIVPPHLEHAEEI